MPMIEPKKCRNRRDTTDFTPPIRPLSLFLPTMNTDALFGMLAASMVAQQASQQRNSPLQRKAQKLRACSNLKIRGRMAKLRVATRAEVDRGHAQFGEDCDYMVKCEALIERFEKAGTMGELNQLLAAAKTDGWYARKWGNDREPLLKLVTKATARAFGRHALRLTVEEPAKVAEDP